MGQAKARGTFEQRKAEAVGSGRLKLSLSIRNYHLWKAKRQARAALLKRIFSRPATNVGTAGHVDHGEP
ncbi:MAG: hypothetical protein ACI9DH_000582 [Halioglobus sp.]|jgi:hypothetical protein